MIKIIDDHQLHGMQPSVKGNTMHAVLFKSKAFKRACQAFLNLLGILENTKELYSLKQYDYHRGEDESYVLIRDARLIFMEKQ